MKWGGMYPCVIGILSREGWIRGEGGEWGADESPFELGVAHRDSYLGARPRCELKRGNLDERRAGQACRSRSAPNPDAKKPAPTIERA